MYFGLHLKYTLLLCDFNEVSIFSADVRKILVKIYDNPSCGSRGVPCGQTDRQTKLIVAFRDIAKEPIKNERSLYLYHNRSRRHINTMPNKKDNESVT